MPPYNFKTTLKNGPFVCQGILQSNIFSVSILGGKKNHYPTLLQTFKVSHVLDLFSVWRNYVSIPESERVVGLKPGFNSKTIQTNTPLPLRPPGPPSLPPYGHTISQRLTTFALSVFFFLFFKNTHRLRVRPWSAEQKPTFCRAHAFSVRMMLPSSSWACTRPTGVGEKTKKEKGKKLAEPDYFEVSSYPERDRVDKAPLVFLQFLYSPPSLPHWGPALHPVFRLVTLTLPLCPHPSRRSKADGGREENGVSWMLSVIFFQK